MARKDPGSAGVNVATRIAAIMTKSKVDSTALLIPPVSKAIVDSVRVAIGAAAPAGVAEIRAAIQDQLGSSPLTDESESLIDRFVGVARWAASPMLLVALLLSVMDIIKAAALPLVHKEEARSWRQRPTRALDVGSVAQAQVRGLIETETAKAEAASTGFDARRYNTIVALSRTRPSVDQLLQLRNRGQLADDELDHELSRLGYDPRHAQRLAELRNVLPGPQDVVRFAVRDVYRPDAVQRGGLLEDLPAGGIADAERVGLTSDEFSKYWASHWVLPSVGQAFEMLHRGVISLDELKQLLRTQDIAPGWRDELIEIAFSVISRVDIRRMYREGIASEEKVLETYLAQGYTQEDSESLTEFAIADATVEARELTKGEVIRLYQDGAVNRGDAEDLLGDLGFGGPEIEWLLVLAEVRRFSKFRELAVSRVRSRYVGRRLSEGEASGALDALGITPEERDLLVDLWDAERDVERPGLTMAMIGRLYKETIIPEEEARVRWGTLGYRSEDIDLLVLNYSDGDPESTPTGAKSKQLTKSDIGRALAEGTISTADAVAGWMEMGYTEGAAFLLASNYLPEEET